VFSLSASRLSSFAIFADNPLVKSVDLKPRAFTMDYNLSRSNIDASIRRYRQDPSSEEYFYIDDWYRRVAGSFEDQEYLVCIYLFLIGANIRRRHSAFTLEQHKEWIKEVQALIHEADPMTQPVRRMYLDYGLKS
jgi:hypothetical protein